MTLTLLTVAFFLATLGIAWFLAGEPERQGAKILAVLFLLSWPKLYFFGPRIGPLDPVGLGLDVFSFLAFAWIALFAWRMWPLWAASLQLLAIVAHVVRALGIDIHPLVYGLMRSGPTYFVYVTLLIGSINNRRGDRTGASMPPWRSWSLQSPPKTPTR